MKTPKTRVVPVYASIVAIAALAIALWAVGSVLQNLLSLWAFQIILLCGIGIVSAVSLNIVNGFTGQFSIGHAGFMLVGAYASAGITVFASPYLTRLMQSAHAPEAAQGAILFAIAIVCSGIAAAVMGLVVGLPSLRLRGDYLAIATLGFGEAIRAIFVTVDAVGGASGLHNIPGYTNFTWVFLCAALVILMARGLALSCHGRALFAIREDEIAAQAVGINTFRYKVLAFVMSSAWAGVAGALIAHRNMGISPQDYGFMMSFTVVVMVVFGGLGSITGAVIAAVLLTLPTELMRLEPHLSQYRLVIYPVLLVILMLLRPQGLLGRKEFAPGSIFGLGKPKGGSR